MKWRLITCLILAFCIVLPSATVAAEDTDITGTVPLVISGVSDSNIGYHGATISWKTNGDATSQVFYDTVYHEDIGDYAYHTDVDTALVSEHSVRLTGLSSGTTYHYRVKSAIPDTEFEDISEEDDTFKTSSPAPAPPPPPTYYIDTDLFTIGKSYRISRTGEILKTIEATSEDENLTMTIPEGTITLDKEGERLETLEAAVDETPPGPPEDAHIIGLAYDFGPDGATFDPPLTLEYTYDPDALPEGVAEEDLVLAYYDDVAGEWVELPCTVDPVTHTITASVAHFTTFAIIGWVPPVPPPPLPAAFSVSSLSVFPAEVEPGETITVSIVVANTGGESGSYTVVLKINGVKEAEKTVTIAAGDSQDVSFSVTKEEAGSYTVTVDGLSDSFTVVAPLIILEPAAFSLSSLAVEPTGVKPSEAVTVSIVVANTGGESGSYTLVLKIDGVKEAEERVTLAAGESQDVSFSATREEPGNYTVDVDGWSGSFTVVLPIEPPGINWALIGGIIAAAVIVAGLLIYFLVIRRRAYQP